STTDESPSPSAIDPALLEELSREPLWVDLDHATQAGTLPASPSLPGGARWIVSHHDIEKTPDADELRSLADGLRSTDADIIKIATLCREPRDAIRLLELGLELGEASCPHVVLGMGAHGAGTRVLGPLWSSSWVYAPRVPDGVTAEGQLSRQLLGTLHDALRIDRRTHHP
ncbi:MAG: type I 3-dehydroquinate dehydratase, partial [Planctomycetota bacterium]